jgi:hypothetical protein
VNVRAVTAALHAQPDRVPTVRLWELLAGGQPRHVRLGAFNQLITRDAWTRIEADLARRCGRRADTSHERRGLGGSQRAGILVIDRYFRVAEAIAVRDAEVIDAGGGTVLPRHQRLPPAPPGCAAAFCRGGAWSGSGCWW